MSLHSLKSTQKLPISLDKAWDFFSSPANLKVITPDYMSYKVTSEDAHLPMFPGMIISYIVRPVMNIPMEWVTEITHVKDHEYFVDEQRFGPYSLWHHKHFFKAMLICFIDFEFHFFKTGVHAHSCNVSISLVYGSGNCSVDTFVCNYNSPKHS